MLMRMRTFGMIVGLLAILAGAVWTLQGVGVIPGSFMSSNLTWVILGLVLVVIGVGLVGLEPSPATYRDVGARLPTSSAPASAMAVSARSVVPGLQVDGRDRIHQHLRLEAEPPRVERRGVDAIVGRQAADHDP